MEIFSKIQKLFLILFFTMVSYANASVVDIFSPLESTPRATTINTLSRPAEFYTHNDLTRRIGSFDVAVGEPLYLKGTITDAFGVPIEGATVRIWQTNAAGRYQTLLKSDSLYIDKNFMTSGSAKTDNLGRYGFYTVFPGYFADRAPHINIVVASPKFDTFTTELYFEKHPRNEKDPQYMSYSKSERNMLTAKVVNADINDKSKGKVATFDMVMDVIHQYKGY